MLQADRKLNIPGESLGNVLSARAFVNWYNGHPDYVGLAPPLDSIEDVVIVGNGNVAIDCARILCKTTKELQSTDIVQHALATLQSRCVGARGVACACTPCDGVWGTRHVASCCSAVKRVTVLGRRGHVQAAFTIKVARPALQLRVLCCAARSCRTARALTGAARGDEARGCQLRTAGVGARHGPHKSLAG
jgi:hypothetical protein